jgi:hypothetical protein
MTEDEKFELQHRLMVFCNNKVKELEDRLISYISYCLREYDEELRKLIITEIQPINNGFISEFKITERNDD